MSKKFTCLSVLFCVCLIASNIFETKIFTLGPLTLTGGFLTFPVSYILNDMITEVYGYPKMRFLIVLALIVNLLFVLMAQLLIFLPGAGYYDGQQHFEYIFRADLRITIASMLAFVCGSLLNSKLMFNMKMKNNRGGFAWRAVLSTIIGESADSLVFFPIAFWTVGIRNIMILMLTQIVLKTVYEIIVLPLTRRMLNFI